MKFKKKNKGLAVIRVLLIFVFFQQQTSYAQEQKVADSLVKIYKKNTLTKTDKMELLRNLAFNETNNLELSLRYAEELITERRQCQCGDQRGGDQSVSHVCGLLQRWILTDEMQITTIGGPRHDEKQRERPGARGTPHTRR